MPARAHPVAANHPHPPSTAPARDDAVATARASTSSPLILGRDARSLVHHHRNRSRSSSDNARSSASVMVRWSASVMTMAMAIEDLPVDEPTQHQLWMGGYNYNEWLGLRVWQASAY